MKSEIQSSRAKQRTEENDKKMNNKWFISLQQSGHSFRRFEPRERDHLGVKMDERSSKTSNVLKMIAEACLGLPHSAA